MYSLTRKSDGAGYSGGMSITFLAGDNTVERKHDARPEVGRQIRVGSLYARTMQWQDWWQTSPVLEILEDTPGKVVFRTHNSVYTWTCDV